MRYGNSFRSNAYMLIGILKIKKKIIFFMKVWVKLKKKLLHLYNLLGMPRRRNF